MQDPAHDPKPPLSPPDPEGYRKRKFFGAARRQTLTPAIIDQTQKRIAHIKEALEKTKKVTAAISGEGGEAQANAVIETLTDLSKDFDAIKQVMKVNEEIKRYLFNPIRSAQAWSIVVTILFGIVGVLLASPTWISLIRSRMGPQDITKDYYHNLKLKNVRKDLGAGLFRDVVRDSTVIYDEARESGPGAQALIYRAAARLHLDDERAAIADDLARIPEIDDFITGQKLLLTAVYQAKELEMDEARSILRRVLDEQRLESFWPDAVHYQFEVEWQTYMEHGSSKEGFHKLEVLQTRLAEFEGDKLVLDFFSGKEIFAKELATQYAQKLEGERKELGRRLKEAEFQGLARGLRIQVLYNAWSSRNGLVSDPRVKTRAIRLADNLQATFPKLKITATQLADVTVRSRGSIWANAVFLPTPKGREFWSKYASSQSDLRGFREASAQGQAAFEGFDVVVVVAKPN